MSIVIDGTTAINDARAIRRYCHHLIVELAGMEPGQDVSVLYLGCKRGTVTPPLGNPRFREIRSSIPGKLLACSWKAFGLPSISFWTGRTPGLIHFPGGSAYVPNTCRVVLTTMHGFLAKRHPQFSSPASRDRLINSLDQAIRRSTHFITVSETNRQELMELWGVSPDRITAIPLGISPEFREHVLSSEAKAALRSRFGIPDRPFLLFVGALEPHKNIDGIIAAYAALAPPMRRELNLVLVGAETPYCPGYRDLAARLGIAANLFFPGALQPGAPELANLYGMAEMLVFPSFYEGWASPPLEAMMCGTPAVVADIPALRESTGGAALYCDPHRHEDIADKIAAVLASQATGQDLRQRGLRFASRFTWRACAEKTLRVYEALA
jgi:alpha-1,3-rhamnosyl/mannosyltransferase